MEMTYRNKNRGYQQLRVWQDAIEYYCLNCRVFKTFQFELRRVGSQDIASADSVHRNIAEGYCRRSLREYLQFLNESLERKQETGGWIDSLIIKESNVAYG
jgi:four helix bundle protein